MVGLISGGVGEVAVAPVDGWVVSTIADGGWVGGGGWVVVGESARAVGGWGAAAGAGGGAADDDAAGEEVAVAALVDLVADGLVDEDVGAEGAHVDEV